MELRNLYYFLQVCEDKSFSAAAAKLYITQQAQYIVFFFFRTSI